ncbi:MAG: PHP domain-containing protein [Clostridiales bacterium]|nr:PHP domain-containing protein [Clostridiales bacterium]
MPRVDLHTHTTFSDGTFTPEEIIDYAVKKNIKALAITDHDNFDGVSEAVFHGKKYNVEVINGIEMSTDFFNKEIHIVGLFIDIKNKQLNSELNGLKEKRKKRNCLAIEKLRKLNINITYNELEEISSNKIITRAHFAKILMRKGYINSVKECFDKYMGEGQAAYVKREVISPEETISLINNAGGIAILAHPLLYNLIDDELNEMILHLKSIGLKGIECIYSTHTEENTKYLIALAKKYNLKISGGSDFHGENRPNLDLGTGYGDLYVPYEVLENLKEK